MNATLTHFFLIYWLILTIVHPGCHHSGGTRQAHLPLYVKGILILGDPGAVSRVGIKDGENFRRRLSRPDWQPLGPRMRYTLRPKPFLIFNFFCWLKAQFSPHVRQSEFWNPGSGIFFLVESGIREIWVVESRILGFGIQNTAHKESRIPLTTESKVQGERIRNPVSRIRNPWHGVQNPRLPWVAFHGVTNQTEAVN